MLSVHLRRATAHDIAFLTDVVLVATRAQGRHPRGFDEAGFRTGLVALTAEQVAADAPAEPRHSTTYVVEIHGERAGRLRVVRTPDFVEIAGIQLLPAHQGQGIGTHLIEQLVVEAHQAGLPARATVQHDNPRARAFYERLGFVAIGEEGGEALLEAR